MIGFFLVSSDKLDSIEKKLNFLIDINDTKEKIKKGKSGGSQVSSKDYDNGGYLFDHFEFDAFGGGFNQQEFDLISEELYKIISNIKRRVDKKNHTTSAIISSNTGDEVAIVQDEIWELCDCLCRLYHQHNNKEIFFTAELPYSDKGIDTDSRSDPIDNATSTPSSSTINSATNKKGRIDYTFHGHQHGLSVSLGLLECKNTSKQVYSDRRPGVLTSDGKRSILQSFIQLRSQVNKLFNSMNVNPKLFVCLLTTGKNWLVLRRQYYQGESFYHSQEVELLTQEGNLVEPNSDKLRIVTNMLLYLLFSIKKVNDDINESKESFTKVRVNYSLNFPKSCFFGRLYMVVATMKTMMLVDRTQKMKMMILMNQMKKTTITAVPKMKRESFSSRKRMDLR